MSFSGPGLASENCCKRFFNTICHLLFWCPLIVLAQILSNIKMFLSTKVTEFITIHPSHFELIKPTVLAILWKMYVDSSCSNFCIGIKISDASMSQSVIDPNEGCCIIRCTFLLTHIIPGMEAIWNGLPKSPSTSFHLMTQKKKLQWGSKVKKIGMQFTK